MSDFPLHVLSARLRSAVQWNDHKEAKKVSLEIVRIRAARAVEEMKAFLAKSGISADEIDLEVRMAFAKALPEEKPVGIEVCEDDFEVVVGQGWRLQFIPSTGPFAGQPITRVFLITGGSRTKAVATCLLRYGVHTHILAGVALHSDERFGKWDG